MTAARRLNPSEPACARCAELEARCAKLERDIQEWQAIAVRANTFWHGFIDELRAEYEERLRVEVWKRRRLRRQLDDVAQAKGSRRKGDRGGGDIPPTPTQVRLAYEARLATEGSAKAAEFAVAKDLKLGSPRTVRRRLQEFEDEVTRSMESPPPRTTDK